MTIALCGSWDHEGACRWPHHSQAERNEGRTNLRVVFVADPVEEESVRRMIGDALLGGHCTGPDGTISQWTLETSGASVLTEDERELARRIAASSS
ncbi:MAG TPA: hypothetical protein VIS71_08595 [Terrimicrobium sp.]